MISKGTLNPPLELTLKRPLKQVRFKNIVCMVLSTQASEKWSKSIFCKLLLKASLVL